METETNNICTRLGDLIRTTLVPLITGDYILLDLPYYSNVGDILIWKGTEDFLKDLRGNCLGRHSKETFDFRPLPKDCTILLLGGGNFGDIWRQHQEFRLQVMKRYPENRIIVLPQTVFYKSGDVFAEGVRKMNRHRNLTICARDEHSAELLREKGFTGHLLTLPDMAFCINQKELRANMAAASKERLILFREDKELKEPKLHNKYLNSSFSDWPQMQEMGAQAWQFLKTHKKEEADNFFIDDFFPRQIKSGVEFASSFKEVLSTRLHVGILRLLLGLPVTMIDNSYGKNLNFYNTWLKDSPLVSTPDEEEQEDIDLAILIQKQKFGQKLEDERQMAEIRQKMQEQTKRYEEIIRQQKESIERLQTMADTASIKHRKYKRIFNWTVMVLAILVLFIILVFTLKY